MFSPLSPLFYGVLYGCKWECNSTQNAPYLSQLSIWHVLGPTVWVPTRAVFISMITNKRGGAHYDTNLRMALFPLTLE